MPHCPQHNKELRLREGVSPKTGKPYKLYTCPTKTGENEWCTHKEWGKTELPTKPENNTKSGLVIILDEIHELSRKIDVLTKLVNDTAVK